MYYYLARLVNAPPTLACHFLLRPHDSPRLTLVLINGHAPAMAGDLPRELGHIYCFEADPLNCIPLTDAAGTPLKNFYPQGYEKDQDLSRMIEDYEYYLSLAWRQKFAGYRLGSEETPQTILLPPVTEISNAAEGSDVVINFIDALWQLRQQFAESVLEQMLEKAGILNVGSNIPTPSDRANTPQDFSPLENPPPASKRQTPYRNLHVPHVGNAPLHLPPRRRHY